MVRSWNSSATWPSRSEMGLANTSTMRSSAASPKRAEPTRTRYSVIGARRSPTASRQRDDGRAEGDDVVEPLSAEHAQRRAEKRLRRVVDEDHRAMVVEDDHRLRQRLQHRQRQIGDHNLAHAASCNSPEKIVSISAITSAGCSAPSSPPRISLATASPDASRYQSRCLRAARTPTSTPYSDSTPS